MQELIPMVKDELFQETVTFVSRNRRRTLHYFVTPTGEFLGVSDSKELSVFDYVDDKAIWEAS